jgi:hypothetical protein
MKKYYIFTLLTLAFHLFFGVYSCNAIEHFNYNLNDSYQDIRLKIINDKDLLFQSFDDNSMVAKSCDHVKTIVVNFENDKAVYILVTTLYILNSVSVPKYSEYIAEMMKASERIVEVRPTKGDEGGVSISCKMQNGTFFTVQYDYAGVKEFVFLKVIKETSKSFSQK